MDQIQEALVKKYNIHPLVFHRSVEYVKTNGELFDVFHTMPKDFPIVWDAKSRSWTETDLLQVDTFQIDTPQYKV